MRRYLVVLIALVLSACNPVENLNQAEEKIEQFQKVYSGGDVDAMYQLTGNTFREVTSAEEFADMYEVFDARLGKVAHITFCIVGILLNINTTAMVMSGI